MDPHLYERIDSVVLQSTVFDANLARVQNPGITGADVKVFDQVIKR